MLGLLTGAIYWNIGEKSTHPPSHPPTYLYSSSFESSFFPLSNLLITTGETAFPSTVFGAIYQTILTVAFQTAACIPAYFAQRSVSSHPPITHPPTYHPPTHLKKQTGESSTDKEKQGSSPHPPTHPPTHLSSYRRVFYRQREAGFFSPSAYLLSSTLAAAPLVVIDSAIFGAMVYWLMGFNRTGGGMHFWLFLVNLVSAYPPTHPPTHPLTHGLLVDGVQSRTGGGMHSCLPTHPPTHPPTLFPSSDSPPPTHPTIDSTSSFKPPPSPLPF